MPTTKELIDAQVKTVNAMYPAKEGLAKTTRQIEAQERAEQAQASQKRTGETSPEA